MVPDGLAVIVTEEAVLGPVALKITVPVFGGTGPVAEPEGSAPEPI